MVGNSLCGAVLLICRLLEEQLTTLLHCRRGYGEMLVKTVVETHTWNECCGPLLELRSGTGLWAFNFSLLLNGGALYCGHVGEIICKNVQYRYNVLLLFLLFPTMWWRRRGAQHYYYRAA